MMTEGASPLAWSLHSGDAVAQDMWSSAQCLARDFFEDAFVLSFRKKSVAPPTLHDLSCVCFSGPFRRSVRPCTLLNWSNEDFVTSTYYHVADCNMHLLRPR